MKKSRISHALPLSYNDETMVYAIQNTFWGMYSSRSNERLSPHRPWWSMKKWKSERNPNGKEWVRDADWLEANYDSKKLIITYRFDEKQHVRMRYPIELDVKGIFVSRGNGIWDSMRISLETKRLLKNMIGIRPFIHPDNLWYTRKKSNSS